VTLDLFDVPVLPGLSTRADMIDATDLTPFRFQGWRLERDDDLDPAAAAPARRSSPAPPERCCIRP
jgi:hypothetical protein